MIEDAEMRELFRVESEEHLQLLDDGLLRLETNPADRSTLEEVFREAHSLKGAARMLGVTDVENVAHRFEDALGPAKRGEQPLEPALLDRLYQALDGIRQLVHEAVTGAASSIDAMTLLEHLAGNDVLPPKGGTQTLEDSSAAAPVSPTTSDVSAIAGLSGSSAADDEVSTSPAGEGHKEIDPPPPTPAVALPPPGVPYRIETIRVDPGKLDLLISQAGELKVATIRMIRQVEAITQLIALREDWSREVERIQADRDSGIDSPDASMAVAEQLSREATKVKEMGVLLESLSRMVTEDQGRLEMIAGILEDGIRMVRLLPLSTLFQQFRRPVREIARDLFKDVQLVIEGGETTADKQILEDMKDPLMHLVRNAIDHGIEDPGEREQRGKPRTGTLILRATQTAAEVVIELRDDGRGLDRDGIARTARERNLCSAEELANMTPAQLHALVFASGFSTRSAVSSVSGRGIGMDVVRTQVERLKGTIALESTPGAGCTARIRLPMTVATTRVLLVALRGYSYALPLQHVLTIGLVRQSECYYLDGKLWVSINGETMNVARLADVLPLHSPLSSVSGVADGGGQDDALPCVVLHAGEDRVACVVEAFLDEQEIVLKPHNKILHRVRHVSGSTILSTGEVCVVLNPLEIIRTVKNAQFTNSAVAQAGRPARARRAILVVEDSLTIRTRLRRLLEQAGYAVTTASDGREALERLPTGMWDAILSDVEMPHIDGLMLTRAIRQQTTYAEVPIILFTSLSSEADKERGMEAGATVYLNKAHTSDDALVEAIRSCCP